MTYLSNTSFNLIRASSINSMAKPCPLLILIYITQRFLLFLNFEIIIKYILICSTSNITSAQCAFYTNNNLFILTNYDKNNRIKVNDHIWYYFTKVTGNFTKILAYIHKVLRKDKTIKYGLQRLK